MSILIKNGLLLDGSRRDVLVEGNRIAQVAPSLEQTAERVIDASEMAVVPGLLNGHTHAAMTLLRGYADDMALFEWLNEKIWPLEAKLSEEDVYWGTKLACLEMIKTGTTFFNDMYWHWAGSRRAVEEMGLRASLAGVLIDLFDEAKAKEQIADNERLYQDSQSLPERIQLTLGPHAIYTVSEASLRWAKSFADEHNLLVHIHLSETEKEVEDCLSQHGKRPVVYLDDIGFLGANVSVGHGIWLDEEEIAILAERGVSVISNTSANMKLAAGTFRYHDVKSGGVNIGIGTDGVSSNNNLDLLEEMKIFALVEKARTADPTVAPASEVWDCATVNTAKAFGVDCGAIEPGKLADIVLIDLNETVMTPLHNLTSSLVYAATGYQVHTTICDGRILMENRVVPGEEEIRARSREVVGDILQR